MTDNSDSTGKQSDRQARYTISYQIDDPDNRFDRVEVTVTPQGGTSQTLPSTSAPTGSVTYTGPLGSADKHTRVTHTITIRVYGPDGVVATDHYEDTPDETSPQGPISQ